jgi:hypothetical protein
MHAPPEQRCPIGQISPHAPQLSASVASEVHVPPHGVCVPSGQGVATAHVGPIAPGPHDAPAAQRVPHAPHAIELVRTSTQWPPQHWMVVPVGHTRPQPPQLFRSVARSRHVVSGGHVV